MRINIFGIVLPDLNPIMNLWTAEVCDRKPTNVTNVVELHRFCQQEWLQIQSNACGCIKSVSLIMYSSDLADLVKL